ncbi:AAA family ATPase [Novipirellula sp.]|uniref:AAA family ATPase n=1 Tax=Novipirellula sp. TaxID=2795430 RepID=UPI00356789E9
MRQDSCYVELDANGRLIFTGNDSDKWRIQLEGRESELAWFLGAANAEDLPSFEDQQMRDLMQHYGIEQPWTSKELDDAKINTTFLVNEVLVAGQHAVIAGASKSMKTSVAIDLALSLGKAERFLRKFWVPQAKRVLFLSAESGESTIQETARRVAESKGFSLCECVNVSWGFWVPKARNSEQLRILEYQIEQSGAEVVVIDPLYQVLDGEDMTNLSMNGAQLQEVVQHCKRWNATAVLVDHVKRSSSNANTLQPLELNDVSGAGKAEFFRQWLLIGRRERFNPDHPLHRLWLTVGGSAGHCGLYALDIDETRDDATGTRQWALAIEQGSEVRAIDAEARAAKQAAKKEDETKARLERNVQKIRDTFTTSEPWTKRKIRDHAGLSGDSVGPAIARLMQLGELEESKMKTRYPSFQWTRKAPIND